MKKMLFCGTLLAALACIATTRSAAQEPLWVQVWSYDVPGEQEYLDALAADFAKKPDGAPVRIAMDKWDQAHAQIADWFAAGKGPDLVVVPDIWLVEFAPFVEPLDARIDAGLKGEFFEVLYNKGVYQDKLLGLVWATSTKALFFRVDLFRNAGIAPPITWMGELGAALALNNPPNVYGLGLPGAREYETDDNFYFYFWSAGGEFFDESRKCTLNSPAGVKALTFYCDLANKYHVTQPELTTWTRKQTRRLFEQGRLAMFATGPWGIEQLRKNAPDIPFAVVPLPVDKGLVTQIITDHIVLAGYSAQKDLATQFLEFAYCDENRLAYAKLGLLPEKEEVAANDYFQKDPAWKVFVDVIPYGRSTPMIAWEKVGIAIREAMYQALTGRKTPQQALDDAAQEIDALQAPPAGNAP